MSTKTLIAKHGRGLLGAIALVSLFQSNASAQSNISPVNKWTWAENAGWVNWYDNGITSGAFVGDYVLSGFIWAENLGWVYLGDGSPDFGNSYSNATALDTGVNVAANGNLFGYAWAENAGWINFDTTIAGALRARFIGCCTDGRLHGYAWGENVGWINLESAAAFVSLAPASIRRKADLDGNTLRNGLDAQGFIQVFLSPGTASHFDYCAADVNSDGLVNPADVPLFVTCLLNGGCVCP
ncbi:MAG: hypothetical protein AABZ08_02245 [Planctomycetota bacterium]